MWVCLRAVREREWTKRKSTLLLSEPGFGFFLHLSPSYEDLHKFLARWEL
jgi:hypothetical protein